MVGYDHTIPKFRFEHLKVWNFVLWFWFQTQYPSLLLDGYKYGKYTILNGFDFPFGNLQYDIFSTFLHYKMEVSPKHPFGGFHSHGGIPKTMDGLFHGKAESKMDDDWGYPVMT